MTVVQDTNVESVTNVDSMTDAQDPTYYPLNTTNESSLQVPVIKKIGKKESLPLTKSSVDIRKLEVPKTTNPEEKIIKQVT